MFVDLTVAFETVWHRGFTYKLLKLLPERHMVSFILFHLYNREAKRELNVIINADRLEFDTCTTYLGVKLGRALYYRQHLQSLRDKVTARGAPIRRLAGTSWGANTRTLRISTLALVYAPAEHCVPVWSGSRHTSLVDTCLTNACAL